MRNCLMTAPKMLGLTLFALLLCTPAAMGKNYYVSPKSGSSQGNGTKNNPWGSLENVMKNESFSGGDTIYLGSGNHGELVITGKHNDSPVTITAGPDQTPEFSRVVLRDSSNWILRGFHVSPTFADQYSKRRLVRVDADKTKIENFTIFSVKDISDWGKTEWNEKAASAIGVGGNDVVIKDNKIENIDFGISVGSKARNAHVVGNVISNFSGDGMRGNGDGGVFEYNLVKNCFDVNKNHDDGFQSWSRGPSGVGSGTVNNVVLRGNVILEQENPDNPLHGHLQGIGCFDGTFVGWTIENNVIIVDHWHGITLLGVEKTKIVNNTVMDLDPQSKPTPWIKPGKHKNGTPPQNVLVRNNLSPTISPAKGKNIIVDHNIEVDNPGRFYKAPKKFDPHLRRGSPAIDAGTSKQAPEIDRDKNHRPQGNAVDVGAYEYPQ